MRYYILTDDKAVSGRWYLKGPQRPDGVTIDPRTFTSGIPVNGASFQNMSIPIRKAGRPLDFTLADFDMPVMRADLAEVLQRECAGEVQVIPVKVQGESTPYAVLNLTKRVECLDEHRSGITWWTASEGRPEKIGQYMIVARPRIDPARVVGNRVFRIRGWEVTMVVDGTIAALLEPFR